MTSTVIAIAIVLDTVNAARMVVVDLVVGTVTMATKKIVAAVMEVVIVKAVVTATAGIRTKI